MTQALWIKADGTTQQVTPANGKKFTLEELQHMVGGSIECKELKGATMWLNEEGKIHDLPYNAVADGYAALWSRMLWWDHIVGDVVLVLKGRAGAQKKSKNT